MASAKTIKGITIEIEGKTSGLVSALEDANKALSKTKSALKDVNDALKLDPGNEDIRTNLEIANLAVVDKINVLPQSFIARWWNSLKTVFSPDGWAWCSVVSFGLLLLCLFAFLMARRSGLRKLGFFVGLLMVACLVLSLVFSIQKYKDLKVKDEAIVMTPTVTVMSSPSENSVGLFVLHEGSKVRILDTAKDWNKIRIADGSVGWLQTEHTIAF